MLISLVLSVAGAGATAGPVAPASQDCTVALALQPSPKEPRAINDHDLIETLDIGPNAPLESGAFFAVSPDGSRVAVGVRRASIANDNYCTGIYVIDQDQNTRLIDAGPGAAFVRIDNFYGTHGFPTGVTKLITPRWSPDGASLAFLKTVGGRLTVQLWDGNAVIPATNATLDIVDFRFGNNGRSIIYKVRDGSSAAVALQQEALAGFRYDERYFPFASSRPWPSGSPTYRYEVVSLEDHSIRAANENEWEQLTSTEGQVASQPHTRASTALDANGIAHLVAGPTGKLVPCPSANCADIEGQPWIVAPDVAGYVRREGWARSEMAVYEWTIGSAEPRRLYSTADLLIDCKPLGTELLCGREGSKRPRYLDRINLKTGKSAPLFEPNPAFAKLGLGRVERLHWTNDRGIECFGDLTYPHDFRPGHRYPLIVVQYESRGFLRGGTGDEFPVQLFARDGYLVLTVQRPRSPFLGQGLSPIERQRRQNQGFVERRSILSAIETEVIELIEAGLADPKRIGITGLSDGSTTVQFAALHSQLFKAASVSGCCWEPSQSWLSGPSLQNYYHMLGWPASPEDDPAMWSDISLARNAAHVAFPILIQAADGEYLAALETVRALREADSPVDLFVFPDEVHIKRHPAARARIYLRNLRWFDFWLSGSRPGSDSPGAGEVARWADMQQNWKKGSITSASRRQKEVESMPPQPPIFRQ